MLPAWRWFGPNDPVSLSDVLQTGANGIVSALHHWPNGEVWPLAEILAYQHQISQAGGLKWVVVESVPVVESIKQGAADRDLWIERYQQTLRHLGEAGIKTVCYNFMPVLDWTRTHLQWQLPRGGYALAYLHKALVAFDAFLLKRPLAEGAYDSDTLAEAQSWLAGESEASIQALIQTLLAGLPGSEEGYTLDSFRAAISPYQGMRPETFRANLRYFLSAVLPVAEEVGVQLAIHPDDPPFSILGLPRVVSTGSDLTDLFDELPSPHNGLTFCTGSLGARMDNDLLDLWDSVAHRVHFLHLRNVSLTGEGDFFEADHLEGRVDMAALIRKILLEEARRGDMIPMRPDHGHHLLDDLSKRTNPGYALIGRMKGLAQLMGVEAGIDSHLASHTTR